MRARTAPERHAMDRMVRMRIHVTTCHGGAGPGGGRHLLQLALATCMRIRMRAQQQLQSL